MAFPAAASTSPYEAIDRHVKAGRGDKLALRWIARDDSIRDFTYAALGAAVNRFCNVLRRHGIGKGDRVSSLLGRVPELYIGALGTLKNGSVFSPMFPAFGPEPIKARMTIGNSSALITTEAFYRRKVESWRKELASLKHVFLTECSGNPPPDTIDLADTLAQASDSFEAVRTMPEDMALLHFTSGTTGKPKGAVHVHEAVVAHNVTGKLALDFHPRRYILVHRRSGMDNRHFLRNHIAAHKRRDDDRRPGRVRRRTLVPHPTGSEGHGLVHGSDGHSLLMKAGADFAKRFDLSKMRLMASVGEPLNPEAVVWGVQAFGKPFHDNWWQTETGGIMITNSYPWM